MKLILIILISLFIVNVYSSIHNTFAEELAALILSSCDVNGQRLNVEVNINENELDEEDNVSIVDIIPSLREIKIKYNDDIQNTNDANEINRLTAEMNAKFDEKFNRLVELSLEVYNKHFESAGFNHNEVFNNYDIIRQLTSNTDSKNKPISLFNGDRNF